MFGECEGREGVSCMLEYLNLSYILLSNISNTLKLSRNQIDLKPFEVGQLHNENNLQMHVTVKILLIADWDCNNEAN